MTSSTRTLHSRKFRTIHAEAIHNQVLSALNLHPNTAGSKRVARVINLIQRAEAIEPELLPETLKPDDCHPYSYVKSRSVYHSGYKFADPQLQARNAEYNGLLKELNKILKRYRWSPVLRSFCLLGLDLTWDFNTSREHKGENAAILWITRLAQQRIICRLRRCRECGRWYYAITDHQHYCGLGCRKKFSSRSAVFKEKRRRYMAGYRRNEKARSAVSLIRTRKASKN